jgi:arsenate reductase
MVRIYGIKNCDTMQKALKWLDSKKLEYSFHDYKELGIDKARLELWLKHFPTDKLINTKSTTWRAFSDAEKASITSKTKAIALMTKNTSVIKRPVWEFEGDRFFLGWDEKALNEMV